MQTINLDDLTLKTALDAETVHLDWDDEWVSKEDAKRYVMEYGAEEGGR